MKPGTIKARLSAGTSAGKDIKSSIAVYQISRERIAIHFIYDLIFSQLGTTNFDTRLTVDEMDVGL